MGHTHDDNAQHVTRDDVRELALRRSRAHQEHVSDGNIDDADNALAELLWDMHARDTLFDAMRATARMRPSTRYPNLEQMRRHILAEMRAEYRWQWRHEPDTSYDNLLAIAEYVNARDDDTFEMPIDGVVYDVRRIFDTIVPHLMSARRNHEGFTRIDYAM